MSATTTTTILTTAITFSAQKNSESAGLENIAPPHGSGPASASGEDTPPAPYQAVQAQVFAVCTLCIMAVGLIAGLAYLYRVSGIRARDLEEAQEHGDALSGSEKSFGKGRRRFEIDPSEGVGGLRLPVIKYYPELIGSPELVLRPSHDAYSRSYAYPGPMSYYYPSGITYQPHNHNGHPIILPAFNEKHYYNTRPQSAWQPQAQLSPIAPAYISNGGPAWKEDVAGSQPYPANPTYGAYYSTPTPSGTPMRPMALTYQHALHWKEPLANEIVRTTSNSFGPSRPTSVY